MKEAWRDIPGYEGYYQASTLGKIRSLDRIVMQKNRWGTETKTIRKGRILGAIKTNGGYLRVTLTVGENRELIRIHSLIMLTFVGIRPVCELVRHLDGNPKNNNLENLAYGTPRANVIDVYRYGRLNGVLTLNQVLEIRDLLKSGVSYSDIAWLYGVCKSNIGMINRRKIFDWLGDDGVICES